MGNFIWFYYNYFMFCLEVIQNDTETVINLVIYNVVYTMCGWSYYQTVSTPTSGIPEEFKISDEDYATLAQDDMSLEVQKTVLSEKVSQLPINTVSHEGGYRICSTCRVLKPDRAHHCKKCNTCVLRMDHHCPWLKNCVGHQTQKYFLQVLTYCDVHFSYMFVTVIPHFQDIWKTDLTKCVWFFSFIIGGISTFVLYVYSLYLLYVNKTSFEVVHPPIFADGRPNRNPYNVGPYNNFTQVFGKNPLLWSVPIETKKNKHSGVEFPLRDLDEDVC